MNSSTHRQDLADYFALLWAARWRILLVTAACVALMALLTAALPRLYVIRAEIDTGPLHQAKPVELNLLVEAIDRNQYDVPGARFNDTWDDSLTASFRAPWTLVLEVRSTDPDSAQARMNVLASAVQAELARRLEELARVRAKIEERALTVQTDVNARSRRLARLFHERTGVGVAAVTEADAAAKSAAARRVALQTSIEARYRPVLVRLRERLRASAAPGRLSRSAEAALNVIEPLLAQLVPDDDPGRPESAFEALERLDARRDLFAELGQFAGTELASLPAAFQQIAALDLQIARGAETRRAADHLRQRDAAAIALLASGTPVANAERAAALKTGLEGLKTTYEEADDLATARAISETAAGLDALIKAYAEVDVQKEGPPLVRVPAVRVTPVRPAEPAWPRPTVNLVIALMFGLVASVVVTVFVASRREPAV